MWYLLQISYIIMSHKLMTKYGEAYSGMDEDDANFEGDMLTLLDQLDPGHA